MNNTNCFFAKLSAVLFGCYAVTVSAAPNPASMGYVQAQIEGVMSYVNRLFDAIPVTPTYTVGQQALGGTVFYVDNTGTHGLVASPKYSGLGSLKTWVGVAPDAGFSSFIVGASGNGIGAGAMNTALSTGGQSAYSAGISQESGYMAALYCVGLSAQADGETPCSDPGAPGETCYGDYYLPSNYELYQMYLKRDVLNMWVDINTTPAFVWSSTEFSDTDAYRINVSEPDQVVVSVNKDADGGVWCIRQF